MTVQDPKKELEEIYDRIFAGDFFLKSREKYRTLRMTEADCTMPAGLCTYDAALKKYGTSKIDVLRRSDAGSLLVIETGAGLGGHNPALVEIAFNEDSIAVRAWAKEGLIPQRTVHGALKHVKYMLTEAGKKKKNR